MKKQHVTILVGICVITTLAFFRVFYFDFVNWDDHVYVTENESVKSFSIGKVIMEPVAGNFHPLTMLSITIDYQLSGGKSGWFHFINLFLHLINTILVYFLFLRLSGGKKWIPVITSLLFAIHPMHVESVAWISERKDVLYSVFFLGGLLLYIKYIYEKSVKKLVGVLLLFVLAILSKPSAVIFPLVLLILDYYHNRTGNLKTYTEKIPFFIISIVFGIITYTIQKSHGAIGDSVDYPFKSRFFFFNFGLMMYILKSVFPLKLCAFYPFPPVNAKLPPVYYFSLFFTLGLLVTFILSLKKYKHIVFAILFYFVNLVLVLQFLPVGSAIMADRYSYIALLGPFFLIGFFVQKLFDKRGKFNFAHKALFSVVFLFLFILTITQVSTWKNGVTLWDNAIKKCPSGLAYNNRGDLYKKEGSYSEALKMYTKAIELNQWETAALKSRGNIYFFQKKFRSAINDYNAALKIEPENEVSLINRGAGYLSLGLIDSALYDFNKAVKLNPLTENGYKNRGMLFLMTNQFQKAIDDYKKHLEIVPDYDGDIWSKIGYSYLQMKDYPNAIQAFNRCISLSSRGNYFYLRALAYYYSGNRKNAVDDIARSKSLGFKGDQEFLKQLGLN